MLIDHLNQLIPDLFSDTLFPETRTYKLSGNAAPINPEYTHKKVKYTVKTFCIWVYRKRYGANM